MIAIATEDLLTEVVCERLVADAGLTVTLRLRRGGSGYLQSKIESFIQISNHCPLLLVTDLDSLTCAPRLRAQWMNGRAIPRNLLFRVAVREVEAWLMADHEAFGSLVGKAVNFDVEGLADPKAKLLSLAKGAKREVREDLVATQGSIASQGVGYNVRLSSYVRNLWSPSRAASNSESLRRAIARINEIS